jgi:hypothetical protein
VTQTAVLASSPHVSNPKEESGALKKLYSDTLKGKIVSDLNAPTSHSLRMIPHSDDPSLCKGFEVHLTPLVADSHGRFCLCFIIA